MATYKNGNLNGKLGNTVYYQLRGKTVARKVGRNTKAPSAKQLASRKKLATLSEFFKPVQGFLDLGFAEEARIRDMSTHNVATKCNFEKAMKGEYPDIVIDYEQVQLSMGRLIPPIEPSLDIEDTGLKVSWAKLKMDPQRAFDGTMLLLYFPQEREAFYFLEGAKREAGEQFIALPEVILKRDMVVYLSFMGD